MITINGSCAPQPKTAAAKGAAAKPATKTPAPDCKTVITKAQFEKLAGALSPNPLNPQQRKQLETNLARIIPMSNDALKKGLDKTPQFAEVMKFARMQILSSQLQKNITEDAAKVPDQEIADYYNKNSEAYEQYTLDRLFVPRTKQVEPEAKPEEENKGEKLTEEQQKAKEAEQKAKQEAAEQAMTQLAESLRARAAAGEDFLKLQKEAFEAAGTKIESPTVALPPTRRNGLPPAQASVFDLKPGEVSQAINDAGGHYIYKMKGKEQLPLDQVKQEIHNKLQSDRQREAMDKLNASFKVETNEAYFGPGGPMPPRMPNPRAPRPMPADTQPQTAPPGQPQTPPAAQPQTPPQAQPPAAKPD